MKKIVLMLLSVVMVASLASCGDNEEPTPKSNNYMMLYRVIMAKNTFNAVVGCDGCIVGKLRRQ